MIVEPSTRQAPLEPIKPIKFHAVGPPVCVLDVDVSHSAAGTASWPSASKPTERTRDRGTWLLGREAKQEPLHLRFCPSLSWEDRVMGFLGCYIIGVALGISSLMSWAQLIGGNPAPFAIKQVASSLLGLLSTSFLVGPRTQLKSMMAPVRLGATIIYLASILLTFVSAVVFHFGPLTLLAMVLQFCALLWYSLSYIPFGRHCLRGCLGRIFRL